MRRGPICKWQPRPSFISSSGDEKFYPVLAPVSRSYPDLTGRLPTCYSPIRRSFHKRPSEDFSLLPAHDLHVLGMPPAFVLSQDQTLQKSLTYKQRGCLYEVLSFIFVLSQLFAILTVRSISILLSHTGCSVQFSKSKFLLNSSLSNWRLFKCNTFLKNYQHFKNCVDGPGWTRTTDLTLIRRAL